MKLRGKRLLVVGGAGFIGSAFCRVAADAGYTVTVFDRLRYAADIKNVEGFAFIRGDIADLEDVDDAVIGVDAVVSFAAGSHVDRAIHGSMDPFIRANVTGVQNLIHAVRLRGVPYVQISSDEVYGPAPVGVFFDETAPLRPGNGYSATKAAGDLLLLAAVNTHGIEAAITRCVNNYGPRQHPEKLIPNVVTRAIRDQPICVHGDGLQVRDWLWSFDHARAVLCVLQNGSAGEIYNVSMQQELTVNAVVEFVVDFLGKPRHLIEHVTDRPGQDKRYGISNAKIKALGWTPEAVTTNLADTVRWYVDNESWWTNKVPF